MAESQTPALDIQTTLAAIMASMQTMREESKSSKEDAITVN